MVRSTSSLLPALALGLALALGGCHITIVPAPVAPTDQNPVTTPVEADSLRPAVPVRPEEQTRDTAPAPAPARIVVVSPPQWAGRNPGTLVVDPDRAVRLVGRVEYQGPVRAVRVNGERAAVSGGGNGITTFVAVVHPPESGSMDVRVDVATPTGDASAVFALDVTRPTVPLPQRPQRPGRRVGGPPPDAPPADTGAAVPPPGAPGHPGQGNPGAAPRSAADSAWAQRGRWAVVIGVGDYRATGIPTRQYAAADARAVAAFLRSPAAGADGIPASRVRLLVDGDATRDNIRSALTTFLAGAGSDDVVMVYFTGTGAPDPARPNAALVLPHDASAASPATTALSADWIAQTLAGLDVHQKILVADVLYAGERRGNRPAENLVHRALVRTTGPRKGGIVAMTAASGAEISQEGPAWGGGHGVFTHHLLTGLTADADADGDGVITLAELVKHAREKVEGATGGRQKPAVSAAAYDRDWPMAVRTGGQ
ncbi:MAG TPA: caspase family protein [Longimicrobiales bacterium]|nr:caspase family protein [Longimicrobiales bacterium]